MNYNFYIGLAGSLILVTGSAWPESPTTRRPTDSVKNWIFAAGNILMLLYSIFGYFLGESIFFFFLQIMIAVATILMMLMISDRIKASILGICSLILVIWSFFIFKDYNTGLFIAGLTGIGLGYAFKINTVRRYAALTFGSILIMLFSLTEKNWIFFGLNLFFAIFSAYYLFKQKFSSS